MLILSAVQHSAVLPRASTRQPRETVPASLLAAGIQRVAALRGLLLDPAACSRMLSTSDDTAANGRPVPVAFDLNAVIVDPTSCQ